MNEWMKITKTIFENYTFTLFILKGKLSANLSFKYVSSNNKKVNFSTTFKRAVSFPFSPGKDRRYLYKVDKKYKIWIENGLQN